MRCGILQSRDIATLNRKGKRRAGHSGGPGAGGPAGRGPPPACRHCTFKPIGLETVCDPYLGDACAGGTGRLAYSSPRCEIPFCL